MMIGDFQSKGNFPSVPQAPPAGRVTDETDYFRFADYSPGGTRNSKELRLKAMEAWRTTCPRHSVWEDALIDGHNPGRKRRENE